MPGSTRSTKRCAPSSAASARWSRRSSEASAQKFGQVDQSLRSHAEITEHLSESARSLREALVSPTARGQWGERMAEDVLRLAGFVENVNYVKQTQVEGGHRPTRLHVPAAQGPRALHGRQVPDGRLPALPRSAAPKPNARRTAPPSCATSGCG